MVIVAQTPVITLGAGVRRRDSAGLGCVQEKRSALRVRELSAAAPNCMEPFAAVLMRFC
jgi:hypothetical protein